MASAPGWYPDPDGKGGTRYFDGEKWTAHRAAPPPSPYAPTSVAADKPPVKGWTPARAVLVAVGGVIVVLLVVAVARGAEDDKKETNDRYSPSSSRSSSPTVVAPTSTFTSTNAPPKWSDPVPFVGNTRCGKSHDPSEESGSDAPMGTYLCAEKNYLHKLASDNVVVHDPVAIIKAGYDHVCAIVGPSDLDTPNLGEREKAAKAEVLASGVVTSSGDAQAVVSDAIIELC
jgi:hypothetical protein